MRDPYDILGVTKTAGAAAIKAAYRKLAKKLHPDANKHDKKAASKFAELNAAYEILGDEDKRKAFDRGEIDAEGKPKFQGFAPGAGPGGPGGFESYNWGPEGFQRGGGGRGGTRFQGGIDDILKDLFGGAGGARRAQFEADEFPGARPGGGQDVTGAVAIPLAEAAKGTSRRVHLPTGKDIEVKIPAGLADGQTIRLKGQGMPAPGGAGDATSIHIAAAPYSSWEFSASY